ncbi:hypothetical protein IV102_08250 [bacterium]|nr:hypothetical protein [bacterium]
MAKIEVGKLTRVATVDGRVYLGLLTGYAEVSQGEDMLEEIYLSGCGDVLTTIQMNNVKDIDQGRIHFDFNPPD